MKATGIIRRIDDLGRIVIPKEIRKTMHIRESDPLEIFQNIPRHQQKLSGKRQKYRNQKFKRIQKEKNRK